MTEPAVPTSSGRFALVLTAIVVTSVAGGAMLSPALHAGLERALGRSDLQFSQVFARCCVACLLVALVVARRSLGVARIAAAWRAESWRERGARLTSGVMMSLLPALAVLVPAIHHSALGWAGRTALQAAVKIVEGVPSALLVGTVEEMFFRVLVFGGLAATWDWRIAAVGSSALYAVVHFLTPDEAFVPVGASPVEGFRFVAASLEGLSDPVVSAAMLGLLLIGLALCTAYHRRPSLALVAGLHMGWFLAAKAAVRLSHLPPAFADDASRIKRMLLIGSPWLWLAVAVTWLAVVLVTRRPDASG